LFPPEARERGDDREDGVGKPVTDGAEVLAHADVIVKIAGHHVEIPLTLLTTRRSRVYL
jgi:hypothetical protein